MRGQESRQVRLAGDGQLIDIGGDLREHHVIPGHAGRHADAALQIGATLQLSGHGARAEEVGRFTQAQVGGFDLAVELKRGMDGIGFFRRQRRGGLAQADGAG